MPPTSGRERIAAAATAVVVVALVLIVALRGSDETERPAAGSTPGSPACGSGDLVAAGHSTETAGGTTYLTATLELAPDAEPCTVEHYPDVVVLDAGEPVDVVAMNDEELGEPDELIVLPDRPVRVTLGWAVADYCDDIDNDGNLLEIAPGLEIEIAGFGPTTCGPGDDLPPVRVGPYTYVDPRSTNGTVTGVVALNGGPGPGTGEFVTRGRIEFDGADDSYGATVDLNGKYEIELPAGSYQVRVSTLQYRAGEPYDDGTVVVVGGELNELNVILPVR